MNERLNDDWPDFPDEGKFDWTLSLKQIEKRYTPSPLIPMGFKFGEKRGEDLSNEIGRRTKFFNELKRQIALRKKHN